MMASWLSTAVRSINCRELYLGVSLRNISRKGAPEMQLQFVLVVSFSKL